MPIRKIKELGPSPLSAQAEHQEALEGHLGEGDWLWLLGGLTFAWREAQLEASAAYAHWCEVKGPEAYAAYRAAQDRADAAQDELSERYWLERLLIEASSD